MKTFPKTSFNILSILVKKTCVKLLRPFFKISYVIAVVVLCTMSSNSSLAYAQKMDKEHELLRVKAAFVLNLARFVEWPETINNKKLKEVNFCFYQDNFLKESVDSIRNKTIRKKRIKIKVIKDRKISEQCEIVLIPAEYIPEFLQFNDFKDLQDRITITDISTKTFYKGSLHNKVIFRLKRDESRLRFEVNKVAAEKMGINIGSELLKLGILVTDNVNDLNDSTQDR